MTRNLMDLILVSSCINSSFSDTNRFKKKIGLTPFKSAQGIRNVLLRILFFILIRIPLFILIRIPLFILIRIRALIEQSQNSILQSIEFKYFHLLNCYRVTPQLLQASLSITKTNSFPWKSYKLARFKSGEEKINLDLGAKK